MGRHRRIALGSTALALGVAGLSACREEPRAVPIRVAPSATASAEALPVDHLLPGELAEGTESAYGLPLPRGFVVERRFDDAIHAVGSASGERVSAYLRRRLVPSTVEVGPARTIFVSSRSKTGVPITVEVTERDARVELVVRNLTPPKIEPGLSDEERWKRTGLKPNGQPLDSDKAF